MAYLIPHNEPSVSLTLDLHEALLVIDAIMERRKERFGQPFPEGAEVTFEQLSSTLGGAQEAEDFFTMMELEASLMEALTVFEEPA